MGIVLKQSFQNLVTTYLGFGLGAVNTLFLYVNFMSDTYYGLVSFILSTAFILVPFLAFGVQNTIVKFYSSFKGEDQDRFLSWMLVLPLFLILPITGITYFLHQQIADFLSSKNEIVAGYVWYIFIIALSSAYFEIFFSWSKVQLKSTFGNFLKEVFHRLGVTLLLVLLAFSIINVDTFLVLTVAIYVVRMIVMLLYAFKQRKPIFTLSRKRNPSKLDRQRTAIIKYSTLIIIAGSVATLLIDIDKFMIGKYVAIENVAYYAVAIYIATVIGVPARAMHQITYPMVAGMLNNKQWDEMRILYKKSSLSLLVISGLLFLLICCNIKSLYLIVGPAYATALYVVLCISASKLLDNCLGINNAIVFNSDYYRIVLAIGVVAVIVAVILNMVLIPTLGINGAGVATLIATVGYSLAKLLVVQAKFKMQPFSKKSLLTFGVIATLFCGFYFWDFSFNPLVAIAVKGTMLGSIYLILSYKLKLSLDINNAIDSVLGTVFKR
ncbi:lipopolysaccharide biosynthesis protein [Dokdonia donghaensis]|uniref:Sugar isomerase n=1 Tax=Dokdonia donghaensis DSW-1 TaxID=1300343 RepID=A0A0A2GZT3_9FLAO|nr:polysaccharide biosynthesis C-terminal domain-containing protein [Dokdonia donghaensis]ANH60826.1 Polysaccharide biosynthesis protein [Dokdonia donghaensis DSW-1]KGO05915.1 sugar isomerase [Dokdonia donghaensis DSW-1]